MTRPSWWLRALLWLFGAKYDSFNVNKRPVPCDCKHCEDERLRFGR